ncbi:Dipeptide chemoreceptor protein [Aliarcobacter skirrowii]|uniref:Chemotaxis protein n=2 Tax=Aliarcobacter skirrowii TaxID=28200 RepID=A0AAD0WP28_9BACT|nr:methyl-accepting chemotaxis protein [Aliarcobacter skirrowii]AXX85529.1 MCP-domain signal transduction protein [Aliarcobacter skirrowii CCUG 10374]KAB0621062.1 chemotaxis protein [Aliarcobacter skirrowii CCUG 10374]RXI26234.1 chemotaxis protein [Aliarcobacter skirrowii CCUG 10374]SUU95936.1 Dipeptide chemoreceptor protein [Aliarcobacter skirrowii]
MLSRINTKMKLLLFPIIFLLIVVTVGAVYIHYSSIADARNTAAIKTDIFIQNILKGRISVYQFLRDPSQEAALKVKEDFKLLQNDVESFKTTLSSEKNIKLSDEIIYLSKAYVNYFDNFAQTRITNFQNGILQETSDVLEKISQMVKIGLELEDKLHEINISAIKLKEESNEFLNNLLITISIIVILLFLIFSLYISKVIIDSLDRFKDGLLGFFAYLNREANDTTLLDETSKDEFGVMSKVVNENILKTKKGIEEDRVLIDETIAVLGEFEQGDLCQRLNIDVSNPALKQLKNVINSMGDVLEKNIENILDVLEKYSSYNYLSRVSTNGLKEQLLELANGINSLGDSVTNMLVENKANGMTLDETSDILLINVDKLNISSNEAAASLEETAAALEEITSNIRNNTQSIAKMSQLANGVTKAVTDGQEMANQTTTAMDEINTQVNLVNEAIGVIDNIAFQTNILSLNAAVEAATAGEAGKGFAVVAQEVRNLATRSAEAAKEIKDIVELATVKANEGKSIATNMIEGYKNLNNNISSTMNLIADIENASKEQLLGIEQINDAVNQLDQQTQQNAMVASQSHDVAVSTDKIAKLIVSDANLKEFAGKNEVKAKDFGMDKELKEHILSSGKNTKTINSNKEISKPKISSTKEIKANSKIRDDEWESF